MDEWVRMRMRTRTSQFGGPLAPPVWAPPFFRQALSPLAGERVRHDVTSASVSRHWPAGGYIRTSLPPGAPFRARQARGPYGVVLGECRVVLFGARQDREDGLPRS